MRAPCFDWPYLGTGFTLTETDHYVETFTGLHWPDFGRTTALNVATFCVLVNSIPPGQQAYEQAADMPETLYESEGWGFESLRARL
jgi:hypothetical protein